MKQLFIALALSLVGCATTTAALSRMERRLTKQEVVARLGSPISTSTQGDADVWLYRLYIYEGAIEGLSERFEEHEVTFIEDRVVSWRRVKEVDEARAAAASAAFSEGMNNASQSFVGRRAEVDDQVVANCVANCRAQKASCKSYCNWDYGCDSRCANAEKACSRSCESER